MLALELTFQLKISISKNYLFSNTKNYGRIDAAVENYA